jgi:NAD(P)H-nitrite reductase large subunit
MQEPVSRSQSVPSRATLPVTPHLPGGYATPEQLHNIAAAAAKYGGTLKITTGSIAILGLTPADGQKVLDELALAPESFSARSVRAVAMCPGNPYCPMAKQDGTGLGLALDQKFFGQPLPAKLRMGVSACPNCCAEVFVKDIGVYGTPAGYVLVIGGNSGRNAEAGRIIAEQLPAAQVISIIENILNYYRQFGEPKERLGQMLDRIGWDDFIASVIPPVYTLQTSAEMLGRN